jgi:hypothetical protein
MAERTITNGQSQNNPVGSLKFSGSEIRSEMFNTVNLGSTSEANTLVATGALVGIRFITTSVGIPAVTGEINLINHPLGDPGRPRLSQGLNMQNVNQVGLIAGGGHASATFEFTRDRHGRLFSIVSNTESNENDMTTNVQDADRLSTVNNDNSVSARGYSASGVVQYRNGNSITNYNIV